MSAQQFWFSFTSMHVCARCHLHNCSHQLHSLGTDHLHQCQLHFSHTGSQLLGLGVHNLCSLFLLFFVPQMSSDCLGLLLGLTLPLLGLTLPLQPRKMLKTKKQKEVIVFPTQRQPLATFTPNTLTQIQNKKTCSTAISFKYVKPVWHESGCSGRVSPSKRPRQSEDICGTKKSKKRLRRL